MSAQVHYFRIGAFVITGVLLGLAAIIVFGAVQLKERPSVVGETYLSESVQGLEVGSSVKMKGVDLGKVDEIGFVSAEYPLSEEQEMEYGSLVFVRFTVHPEALERFTTAKFEEIVKVRVDRGMRVRLASQGITGIKYLDVDMLDPGRFPPLQPVWTPRNIYIPAAPGTFKEIMDSVGELTQKLGSLSLEKLVTDIQGLVASVRDAIAAAHIDQIGAGATQVLGDMHGILRGQEFQATLANLRDTTETSRQVLAKLDRLVDSEAVQGSVANLHEATVSMKEALERVQGTIGRLDTLLSASRPDMEDLMSELRVTIRNLRELTDVAKRYPSSLVFGEKPKESDPTGGNR